MNSLQLIGALELGLVYGIVAVGVYLTFRVIDFPDLSVDGSFPLGGAVAAAMMTHGFHPLTATLIACCIGSLAGVITGILHIRFKILGLLAGILTMTALYSINLRIMGRPNITLLNTETLFSFYPSLWILGAVVAIVIAAMTYVLLTDIGLGMRATGMNARMAKAQGIPTGIMVIIVLALSNALVALSGALMVQKQGFADISMGAGTIIIGLASVIIGEKLLHIRHAGAILISCVLGSIIYRIAIAIALNSSSIGLKASDLNLVTACIVAIAMIMPRTKQLMKGKR